VFIGTVRDTLASLPTTAGTGVKSINFTVSGSGSRKIRMLIPVPNTVRTQPYHYTVDNVTVTEIDASVYTEADVLSYQDYFPFGMTMEGRFTTGDDYRYGFNGMESDDEVKGNDNSYTTPFRQYDGRVGRWASIDPLSSKYASHSPYLAFNGNPIRFSDATGLEGEVDGNGNAQAKVYFVNKGLSEDEFNTSVQNAINDINQGLGFNGIGSSQVEWSVLNPSTTDGEVDQLLSENRLNNVIELTPDNGGTSNVRNGNKMTLYQADADGGFTSFHEFGHFFGLSDRYAEAAAYQTSNIVGGRLTIPLNGGYLQQVDPAHQWNNNAYSSTPPGTSGTYQLTSYQINTVMSDIDFNEFDYNHGNLYLLPSRMVFNTGTRPPRLSNMTINQNAINTISTVMMNLTSGRSQQLSDYVRRGLLAGTWIGSDRNLLNRTPAVSAPRRRANNSNVNWYDPPQ
jgi:RHS repeat-associated protein